MAWYYDLVVLAILVLCVWNGMRKGIRRSLLQTAATVLSAVIAFLISQPLAELCYTTFLEQSVVSFLEERLDTVDAAALVQEKFAENGIPVSEEQVQAVLADPEGVAAQYGLDASWVDQQLETAAATLESETNTVLPSWLWKEMASDTDSQLETAKAVLSGNPHQAAQTLADQYGKPILCAVLQVLVFLLGFALLRLVLQAVLLWIPDQQTGSALDLTVGAVVGLVKAGVCLWMMVLLTKAVVAATNGETAFFTETMIQKTYLFRLLYH